MNRHIVMAIVGTVFLITGCATSTPKNAEPVTEPAVDKSIEELKEGADRIHQELVKLAKFQQQHNYESISRARTYDAPTEGPLSKRITLSWAGPIDKMVAKLAEEAGFYFPTPLGKPLFRDTLVQVDVINTPIYNVLEDVGWQAGDRIYVILDMHSRTISLAYKGE